MKRLIVFCVLIATAVPVWAGTVTVTATWENPTTGALATGTRMERSADGGSSWVTACTVDAVATSCADTPQPVGQTYQYRIVRFNEFGDAPASEVFSLSTATPTAPVTNAVFTYSVHP